jgi:hypothetical protein
MKRAAGLSLLLLSIAVPAYAQQATPEDFGTAPQPQPSQQPQPTITVIGQPQPSATPYPTQTPTTPTPVVAPEKKLDEFKPALKVQLGYQYARMYGIPISAGRLRLGVGAQNDVQAHYFTFSSMVGATETDRRVWDLRVGYEGELRLVGIVRLGLGLETGYVFVRRASIDERMWALGIGAQAHVGVDAITWGPRDDHALYLEARIEGHIHWGNADMWGPTLSLGFRF